MIYHENRLLAEDSHEISYLFFRKLGKLSHNLPSAAVVIGALKVKAHLKKIHGYVYCKCYFVRNSNIV